jgi:hypothetical protein
VLFRALIRRCRMSTAIDPDEYVRENKETLVKIIKHGDDEFVRAMALTALVMYGDDPDPTAVRRALDRYEQVHES